MFDAEKMNSEYPLTSESKIEDCLKEISGQEQLYSIALFDILGFSNFVAKNGTQVILDLYNKLLDIIHAQESTTDGKASFAGSVAPVLTSPDWKLNALIADANGFVCVCHFNDTFIIYVNYLWNKQRWWLADTKYESYLLLLGERKTTYSSLIYQKHNIYLSFLQYGIFLSIYCRRNSFTRVCGDRICSNGLIQINIFRESFSGSNKGRTSSRCIRNSFW